MEKETGVEELSDEEMSKVAGALTLAQTMGAMNNWYGNLTGWAADWRAAMHEYASSIKG